MAKAMTAPLNNPEKRNKGGRPKGSPNKLTKTIREAIEAAFDKVGGPDYLASMAYEQPVAFMSLLGKAMPTQVNASVQGSLGLLPASIDDLA